MPDNFGASISSTSLEDDAYNRIKEEVYSDNTFAKFMRSNGLYDKGDLRYFETFYRLPRMDPHNYVEGAREYIFMTKPDLDIFDSSMKLHDDLKEIPFFVDLYNRGYAGTVLDSLTHNGPGDACPFIRLVSNRKTNSIDIPDITSDIYETSQNMFGTKIIYDKSSMQSDEGADFTIEFEDTKYTEVYLMWKAYDLYRKLKWLGIKSTRQEYVTNKILYAHMSLYKFLVDVDGETILFAAKYTGIAPTNISRSSFNEIPERGPLKVTVTFKCTGWLEDSEPNIYADFNHAIRTWITGNFNEIPIWDNDIDGVSGENCKYPFIVRENDEGSIYGYKSYRLLFGN